MGDNDSWFRPYTRDVVNQPTIVQPATSTRTGLARSYADIPALPIDYLWPNWIPLAEVTLVGGDCGIGKGRWLADFTSRVSRGDDMLDHSPGLGYPGNIMLVTPEDDPSTSMAWRLRAHKADLGNVYDLTEIDGDEFSLPGDLPSLRAEMLRVGNVKLVIIDPVSQVSEYALTANRTVRKKIWGPLRKLAKDTGAAIVVMLHTVKNGDLQGSKGIQDVARVILKITRDKDDKTIRRVSLFKANEADDDVADICYTITGVKPDIVVEYIEPDDLAALEGLTEQERKILMLVRTRQAAGQMTDVQQVASLLHCKATAAKVALSRMAAKDLIEREHRGLYRMPA